MVGIAVGMHYAPATKKLRSLLAKNPRAVLSVLKEDAAKPGKALAAGKRLLQNFRAHHRRLIQEHGGVEALAFEM